MTNIPSGYALIRTEFQMSGAPYPAVITCGVVAGAGYTAHDINNVWWGSVLAGGSSAYPLQPANYTAACTVKNSTTLLNRGGVMTTDTVVHNQVGTGSWQPPAANVAIIQRKKTGLAGRANRGRMYWPCIFVDTTDIDTDGTMASTSFSLFKTNASSMMAHMATAVINPVIIHSAGGTPTLLSDFSIVEDICATQRRRLRR